MSTQFTPGPWAASELAGNWLVLSERKYVIASIGWLLSYAKQHEANARLIAAAPDLLAALRSQIEPRAKDWRVTDWDIRDEQARAAIARAVQS